MSCIKKSFLCKVCCDQASGRHYGQMTCEGCKSFFKRSLKRSSDYVCRGSGLGNCEINVEQRNQCQACRLRKCIKIGMKKDGNTRVRTFQDNPLNNSNNSNYKTNLYEYLENLTSRPRQVSELIQELVDNKESPVPNTDNCEYDNWDNQFIGDSQYRIKDILDGMLLAEKSAPIIQVDNFVNQSMNIVYSIISWSKYMLLDKTIPTSDQLILLKNCWHQLFLINYCLCNLSKNILCNDSYTEPAFLNVKSQLLALHKLSMDEAEYGCIKSLIFFDPDIVIDSNIVDQSRELIQESLFNHIKNQFPNYSSRFGKVLLRIPYLKTISVHDVFEVFFNNGVHSCTSLIDEVFIKSLEMQSNNGNEKYTTRTTTDSTINIS